MDMISWLYKGQEKASLPTAECVILEIAGCPEKVDDAHLRAAEIEMRIAHRPGRPSTSVTR